VKLAIAGGVLVLALLAGLGYVVSRPDPDQVKLDRLNARINTFNAGTKAEADVIEAQRRREVQLSNDAAMTDLERRETERRLNAILKGQQ
jgi:hypothetical protein